MIFEHSRYAISLMSDIQMSESDSPTGISYSLRELLDKFTLPRLVKVYEGYYDEHQSTTIGADTVYNLLTSKSVETALFEDADGEETRIPLDDQCTVERVLEERFQWQLRLQDLVHDSSAVKFVRVIETDPNFETVIKNGDKLKIERKKSRENFVAFKNVSDKGKPLLKVPASCQAKFQALWDGEELLLAKFVKKNTKLPVYVSFVDNSTDENITEEDKIRREKVTRRKDSSRRLPDGVVKLKGILADSFVTATTEIQGVTSRFSFSKTLPIRVVPVTMEATTKAPDAAFNFISSQNNEANCNDVKESTEDENQYEDMSGFKTLQGSPWQSKMGVKSEGNSENHDKNMTIGQMAGLGARHNTYSPAPSIKDLKSKSVTVPRTRTGLLQRTVSDLQLQTNFMESKDHVYDDLKFSALPEEVKSNPSCMARRKSDSSTYQVSKQNLNNMLHVQVQNSNDESCQGKVEMVSLQIAKNSPALMPHSTMKTFGRKGRVAETESVPDDAQNFVVKSCASQSLNTNLLPESSTSSASKTPFYSSEETEFEAAVALNQNILLAPQVRRTSRDALPPRPSVQDGCSGESQLSNRDLPVDDKAEPMGRRSGIRVLPTSTTLPKPPQSGSGKDTNQFKTQQQPLLGPTSSERDSSTSTTKKDPPSVPLRNKQTGEVPCPVIPPKATHLSRDNTHASSKGRQPPVPSPRVKPRSYSKSSREDSNLSPATNEQKIKNASGVKQDTASPGTEQEPKSSEELYSAVKKVSKSNFIIPQDLSALSVPEVQKCLKALNMQQFEKIFNERQVDGSMLVCLDEESLESLGMDRFHRLKLVKVIAGWRPQLY